MISLKYRIRLIKRMVTNKYTPPLFFTEIGGPASAKDCLLMLNLPPEVTKTHTFPLAVSANQRWIPPFQQSLHALTVHIRRMIVLLTN